MREGDWMSLEELQREQMTDEDKEIALWVSDKMPQLVKDLTRICRIPSARRQKAAIWSRMCQSIR